MKKSTSTTQETLEAKLGEAKLGEAKLGKAKPIEQSASDTSLLADQLPAIRVSEPIAEAVDSYDQVDIDSLGGASSLIIGARS